MLGGGGGDNYVCLGETYLREEGVYLLDKLGVRGGKTVVPWAGISVQVWERLA